MSTNDQIQMANLIWDEDGFVRPEVLEKVEIAIRRYPIMDAPQWLGGVDAIRALGEILGIPEPDEDGQQIELES